MAVHISVLVPVYRSEKSLEELYNRLNRVLSSMNDAFEIILIDDGSPDRSFAVMQSLHEKDSRVKIIQLDGNFGQHHATYCGLHYCRGNYIVTLDDDLQHPPEEIPRLLDKLGEGYDAVMGLPLKRQSAWYKDWGSMLIDKCLNLIYHKPPALKMSSYRIMNRELVQKIIARPRTNIYMGALILSHQPRLANVEINHAPRKYGKSNYSIRKSVRLAWTLLSNYSILPLQLMGILWWLIVLLSIGLLLVSIKLSELNLNMWLSVGLILISLLNLISLRLVKHYFMRFEQETIQAEPAYVIKQMDL